MKTIGLFVLMLSMIGFAKNEKEDLSIDCHKMNCTREFREALREASRGDASAQNEVGERLHFGKGVQKNYHLAKVWYLHASNQGHPVAPNHIGRLYLNGEGVNKNALEACSWYKISGERGHKWGEINYKKCQNRTRISSNNM